MNRLLTVMLMLILITGLLITGCSSGFTPGSSVEAPQVGSRAPDFQLPDMEGQLVSLSSLRGQPVLLNFWTSWCPACRDEMPYLQEIFEEWTDRGLVVLAIDIGESFSTVEEFMQSYELTLPVLLDTNEDVTSDYNVRYLPTTFLIDKDGIIQAMKIGSFSSTAQIEGELSKIMP